MAASSYFSIIALIFLTINLNLCSAATTGPIHRPNGRNTRFIRTSCRTTLFPNLCFTTFSKYSTRIRGNPRFLATTGLSLALNTTRSATKTLATLSKRHGLNRKDAAALRDCVQQLGNAVDELKDSISEMSSTRRGNNKDFRFRMSNIQTWVSAALTNEDTCMDGFSSAGKHKINERGFKIIVRGRVRRVGRLTSIVLAFVNRYVAATTH
ncbi:Pectinesterase inhibitor [Corchorus capsularis]|uniref:Pectinesterase inhibitor n=1 Tax=Corchorus capsularis TaxID=210143 RepID=A0A1R3K573_COCAP|nr:Pectinesterase inhibitor [Corchorus capsularis]